MGMTEHYNVRLDSFDQLPIVVSELIELAEDVPHDYPMPVQLLDSLGREASERIVIAFDCDDRSNLFKPRDDLELADVAGVNDQVHTREDRHDRFIEQAMSVRNDADLHR
jgi:hypothetical protein